MKHTNRKAPLSPLWLWATCVACLVVGCDRREQAAPETQAETHPAEAVSPDVRASDEVPSTVPSNQPNGVEDREDREGTSAEAEAESDFEERVRAAEEMRRLERQAARERAALPEEPDYVRGRGTDSEKSQRKVQEEEYRINVAEGRETRSFEEWKKDMQEAESMMQLLEESQGMDDVLSGGAAGH